MPDAIPLVPFALLATAALGGAVAAALSRDTLRTVYWSIEAALAVSGLCLLLSAEYLAVAHLAVFAGALPACALLTHAGAPLQPRRLRPARAVAFATFLTLAFAAAVAGVARDLLPRADAPARMLGVAELGGAIFARWSLPVEIVAVILLAVLVAAALSAEEGRSQ